MSLGKTDITLVFLLSRRIAKIRKHWRTSEVNGN